MINLGYAALGFTRARFAEAILSMDRARSIDKSVLYISCFGRFRDLSRTVECRPPRAAVLT